MSLSWFPDLAPDDVRQLCYIAYYGEDYGSAIPNYLKGFHKTRKNYEDTVHKLQHLGYLQTHNFVMPEHHLDVLDFLAIEHQDWLKEFKAIRHYSPTRSCEYLWKLAALLRKDDFEAAAKLPKPYAGLSQKLYNIYPYIRERVANDSRYARLLSDEQVYLMTADTLEDLFQRGTLDEHALDTIRQFPSPEHPKYRDIIDRVDLYEYFVTGTFTIYDNPKTLWAWSMVAIKEMYEGNTENALSYFRKAVKTQGSKAGSLPIPLLNYFLALCVIKYRLKYGPLSITDVLNDLRGSSPVKLDNNHFAARLLLEYAEVTTENASNDLQRRANMILEYANTPANRCYAALLAHFFSLSGENLQRLEDIQPSAAIMMHELSPYTAMSTKAKENLEMLYGGKPILANIHRKASWELLLGEIDTTLEKDTDTRPRRIVYFLKGTALSSIVEQVEKEESGWEDARLLSCKILCKEGYESMDLQDSRIAMGLANKEQWQTDADIIVPNLIGTERLFYGVEYNPVRTPGVIVEDKPYIEFSGQGDKIVISSNAKLAPDGFPRKHTVTNSGTNYTVVTLNPLQKDILSKLLSRKSLPASAAPSLRKTIESLNGIIEVRENILSDIEMKAFESDGHIAIRIEPVKNNLCTEYRMTMLAMPLPEGFTRLIPATGEEYVYDEDETGRMHCVHRDMAKEEENYQGLVDYAEQFDLEFSSYNVAPAHCCGDKRPGYPDG